jgi:hypothetical protein
MPVKPEQCHRIFAPGAFPSGRLTYSSAHTAARFYTVFTKRRQFRRLIPLLSEEAAIDSPWAQTGRRLRPQTPALFLVRRPTGNKQDPHQANYLLERRISAPQQHAGHTKTQVRLCKPTILKSMTYVEDDLDSTPLWPRSLQRVSAQSRCRIRRRNRLGDACGLRTQTQSL